MVIIMQDTINLMNKCDISNHTTYIKNLEKGYEVLETKQLEEVSYYKLKKRI